MDKRTILDNVCEQLEALAESIMVSARAAYQSATHAESKSENKYDVRGLLDSYLAEAQAKRVAEIRKAQGLYRNLVPRRFDEDTPLAIGALVSLEDDASCRHYFLGPQGGAGLKVEVAGETVHIVTASSPLGKALLGKHLDEEVVLTIEGRRKQFEIVAVL